MRRIALLALALSAPALCCSECGEASAEGPTVQVSATVSWEQEFGEVSYSFHPGEVSHEVEWYWYTTPLGSVELRYRSVYYGPRQVRCRVEPWRVRVTACVPHCRIHHVHYYPSCHRGHGRPVVHHYQAPSCKVRKHQTHVYHYYDRDDDCRGHHKHHKVRVKKEARYHSHTPAPREPVTRRPLRPAPSVRRADMRAGVSTSSQHEGSREQVVSIARNGTVPVSTSPRQPLVKREVRRW